MKTGVRITAFAAALAGAFGAAYGIGQTFDPVVADRPRRTRSGIRQERRRAATTPPPRTRPAGCRSPRAATPSTWTPRR